jgi:hypothetical protein
VILEFVRVAKVFGGNNDDELFPILTLASSDRAAAVSAMDILIALSYPRKY